MFHIHRWNRWSDPERLERAADSYGFFGDKSSSPVLIIIQARSCRGCGVVEARESVARSVEVPRAFAEGMK